ncbi:MAG: cytidylate kinase-like family protein [Sphaerochaeta sp.]|nr:cytidylate kinase-like family protein [Sphaerochaeta sp.]
MAVITISRKLGSMGTYIGRKLAERIGYDYVDKQCLSLIMKEYGFSKFDNIYDAIPSFTDHFDEYRDNTIKFLATVIMAVAQHDNVVIAGRGSFGLLNSYSDVINVRITAPVNCRIKRVMEQRKISEVEAREVVEHNDLVRRHFVESDFRFNYANTADFDLILDTSIVPPDLCVDWLEQIYAVSQEKRQDSRHSIKTIEVEGVLENHVRDMLALFREEKKPILYQVEQ